MHSAHMHNGFITSMTKIEGACCPPSAKDTTQEVMDVALNFNQLTCFRKKELSVTKVTSANKHPISLVYCLNSHC